MFTRSRERRVHCERATGSLLGPFGNRGGQFVLPEWNAHHESRVGSMLVEEESAVM
jgi:hypothetical protein